MYPLRTYSWPRPHLPGRGDTEALEVALHQDDWSHTAIAKEFEEAFARFVGSRYAVLVPNGTSAIYLSLLAAGIKRGQEVILPGLTWPSVVYAIIMAGGVPRTIDICADTFCIAASEIAAAINPATFAVIPTHLFGSQCSMADISTLASRTKVLIIEDAAQSVGSIQGGKACGTWGIAGAFSLNDRKVLACGEGGCIVTDDPDVYNQLRDLQLILPNRPGRPRNLPGTYKVSEFQAAVALSQLQQLEDKIEVMAENARILRELLSADERVPIKVQSQPATVTRQSYYNFCFLIDESVNAARFRSALSENLNLRVAPAYEPLFMTPDFRPTLNGLHPRARKYLLARHRNCQIAYEQTCVRLPHFALRAPRDVMDAVAETIFNTARECQAFDGSKKC